MHPANHDLAAQVREQGIRQVVQQPVSQGLSPQTSRVRSLQSEESWIDIPSRNSTSSLSSTGDEDTLTSERGFPSIALRRRRRLQRVDSGHTYRSNGTTATGNTDSSQEEYEESESEQDQILTSSNEDFCREGSSSTVQRRRSRRRATLSESISTPSVASSAEGITLILDRQEGSRMAASFQPQPNAFTHPPLSRNANSYQPEPTGYFSAIAPMTRAVSANSTCLQSLPQASSSGARSASSNQNSSARARGHTPYNVISPSHNVSVDHDAALRASLSTLLSCAAARRSAPKRDSPKSPLSTVPGQRIAQGTLCLIPESDLDRQNEPYAQVREYTRPKDVNAIYDEGAILSMPKSPKRKSKSKSPLRPIQNKKNHSVTSDTVSNTPDIDPTTISPAALWLIGVGALFLGGAVLFTAGYIQGREVGYVEGFGDASAAVPCRGEAAAGSLRGMGRKGWRSATAGASIWGVS